MSNLQDVRVSKWAYLAPLMLGGLLALSAGSLFILGWIGGTASGDRVELSLKSTCPEKWAEIVEARGLSVGLGDPEIRIEGEEVLYVATLPGNEDDLTAMPALLTKSGVLEVYAANEHGTGVQGEALATNDDIMDVAISMDSRGHPYVDLELQPHAAERMQEGVKIMIYLLDGKEVDRWLGRVPFEEATVRLQPRGVSKEANLREAVDWNIVLRDGPAPCPVDALSLVVLDEASARSAE
jgi:hypothetical protein